MSPRVRVAALALAASLALAADPAGALAQQATPAPAMGPATPAAGAARRPVAAEDLYRLKNASDVAVSPDGRWVAYVVTRVDSAENRYARDIWLAGADGSQPRQLTFAGGSESSPTFSPDGRSLAFVARRANDSASQLYLLSLAGGGEARRLTDIASGVAGPAWSPDGRRIAFASQLSPEQLARADSAAGHPDSARGARPAADTSRAALRPGAARAERLAAAAARGDPHVVTRLGFLAETGLAPERWGQIYVVGVEEGSKPVKLTSGAFPHLAPAWSPDGRSIAFMARPPKGTYEPDFEQDADIWLVPADGTGAPAAPRNLTGADAPPPGLKPLALPGAGRTAAWSESDPSFSPDGKRIAYLRTIVGEGESAANAEVVVRDLATGAVTCASCALDRSARGGTWAQGGAALYFTVQDRGGVALYRAAGNGTGARPVLSGARGVLAFDVAGGTLAWAEMNPADPAEVYVSHADGGAPRRLTRLNDELLAGLQVQPYEELDYAAPDHTRMQGWVVRPPGFRPGMPLAVEMHGGPHAMWGPGEQSMWLEYQTLAGDGYVVFFSNPRGSDGYGAAWKQAIHRNWGDLAMGDVLAGADSVIARGWADRERQYLTGGSYAGFLTAWMVGHTDRFKAAASQRGVYDMTAWYGTANTWRLYESEFGSVPWQDPELARQASPITYVERMHTPLLILHGEEDRRVGMAGAEMLFRDLKLLGRDVEFVRYPREGHELTRSGEPAHRIDHLNRIVDWFDRHPAGRNVSASGGR